MAVVCPVCGREEPYHTHPCPELRRRFAKAIEARRAATGNTDAAADESAAPKGVTRKDKQ